ncbi:unnamed protein product [Durusdinium trenchii]|uniref:Uncharacterized protein n=1 Tax=Durusdinium trenchii TaxID=1381693 RepID=A0ABP0KJL5_9DINO
MELDDLNAAISGFQDGSVLSAQEKAQFVLAGFVKVRRALSAAAVSAAGRAVWAAAERQEEGTAAEGDDVGWSGRPSAWERGDVMMKQQIPSDLLQNASSLHGALDDLLGRRWSMEGLEDLGWAPMRFPAARLRCQRPSANGASGSGWGAVEATRVEAPCQYHLDGSWYQHHLFCPQQAIIVCVVLTDTALGGAGTAVKLASHFYMAQLLASAGAAGMDHASLCSEAQAIDVQQHPEYEIYCNAGDVLLLHPHLAHSSTTNVRFGSDVRLALTKRAYWVTGPSSSLGGFSGVAPVELPLSWAVASTRTELPCLVRRAQELLAERADASVLPWLELQELTFEARVATAQEVDARLEVSISESDLDLGGLLLMPQTLAQLWKVAAGRATRGVGALSLGFARCGLGPAGSVELERCLAKTPLPLRALFLQGNAMGDGGVVGLLALAADSLRALETLSLSSNELSETSVEALADALGVGSLRWLKLNQNRHLGQSGATGLARLTRLERLELRCCPLKDAGLDALLEKLESSRLQALDLERTRLTDAAAVALAESARRALPDLVALSLRACQLTDRGAAPLLAALWSGLRRFQKLDLGRNLVGDPTVEAFAELVPSFYLQGVTGPARAVELLLGTNQVTDRGVQRLVQAFDSNANDANGVKVLNFTSNRLTSQSLLCVTEFLEKCSFRKVLPVEELDLTYNDTSVDSVAAFRAAVLRLGQSLGRSLAWSAGCG